MEQASKVFPTEVTAWPDNTEIDDTVNSGEVCTGPEDFLVVLYHKDIRFIVIMLQLNEDGEGDIAMNDETNSNMDTIVTRTLRKIMEAQHDPDEMIYDRRVDDAIQLAVKSCRQTIYEITASVLPSTTPKQHYYRNLHDFLHPTTFYVQLTADTDDNMHATKMDDNAIHKYASTCEAAVPILLRDCLSRPMMRRRQVELISPSKLSFL